MTHRDARVDVAIPSALFLILGCLVAGAFSGDWFWVDVPGRYTGFRPFAAAPGLWGVFGCTLLIIGLTLWLVLNATGPEPVVRVVMGLVIATAGLGVLLSLVTLGWGVADAVPQVPGAAPTMRLRIASVAFAATGSLSAIAAGMCGVLRRVLP